MTAARPGRRITNDARIQGNGYFSRVFLDPHNPDIVFVAQTSLYRSTDGGVTFESYKGAPGGDDNHALWIDPTNSDYMIMGSDQGATISMDGGKTWTSWYNQPTGQIYHVSTDNRFPYWVYGTQQDSGSVATLSRGDYGAITFLDWDPIGGYEFGYIRPRSHESQHCLRRRREPRVVAHRSHQPAGEDDLAQRQPRRRLSDGDQSSAGFLAAGSAHVLRRHAVPAADQRRRRDLEGDQPGPDESPGRARRLPRPKKRPSRRPSKSEEAKTKEAENKKPKTKEEEETMRPPDRRAITAFSLSPVKPGVIWVGTNNGLVQITTDNGATWQNVSPPGLQKFSEVTMVEASHFDAARLTSRSTITRATISARTSSAPAITARAGRRSWPAFPTSALSKWCAKIPRAKACFTPEPKPAHSFRSTTAISGARCS